MRLCAAVIGAARSPASPARRLGGPAGSSPGHGRPQAGPSGAPPTDSSPARSPPRWSRRLRRRPRQNFSEGPPGPGHSDPPAATPFARSLTLVSSESPRCARLGVGWGAIATPAGPQGPPTPRPAPGSLSAHSITRLTPGSRELPTWGDGCLTWRQVRAEPRPGWAVLGISRELGGLPGRGRLSVATSRQPCLPQPKLLSRASGRDACWGGRLLWMPLSCPRELPLPLVCERFHHEWLSTFVSFLSVFR